MTSNSDKAKMYDQLIGMNHVLLHSLFAGKVSIGGKPVKIYTGPNTTKQLMDLDIELDTTPEVPASATPKFQVNDKVVLHPCNEGYPSRYFWMVSEVHYGNPVKYRLTSMSGDVLDWTSESYLAPFVAPAARQVNAKFEMDDKVWHHTFVGTDYAFMTIGDIIYNGDGYVYGLADNDNTVVTANIPESELHPWAEPDESARTLSLGDYVVLASDQMGDELPFKITGYIWGGDEWFIAIDGLNPDMIYPQSGWKLASFTSPFKNGEPVQIIKPRDKFEATGKPYEACGSISPNTTRIKPWGSPDGEGCYSIPTECLADFPKPKFDGGDTVEFVSEGSFRVEGRTYTLPQDGRYIISMVRLNTSGVWEYDMELESFSSYTANVSGIPESVLKLAATDEFQFEVGDYVRIKATGERRNIAKDAGGDWWVLNGGRRYPSAQLELIDRPETVPTGVSEELFASAELHGAFAPVEPTLFDPELVMTRQQRDGLMEALYGPDSDPLDAEANIGKLQQLFPVVQNLSVKPE